MSVSFRQARARRGGFTLAEILIATALALLLMAAVVRLFAAVTSSVSDSRAIIEIAQSLQTAQIQLQNDLRYATARGAPPFHPEDQKGYLEIIEGPGPFAITSFGTQPIKIDEANGPDGSVGDMDDILMLTVRSFGEPFYGRWLNPLNGNAEIIQSQDAEIAWFVRGNKLHRRVRLITPNKPMTGAGLSGAATDTDIIAPGFSRFNDSSVRLDLTYGDKRAGQTLYNEMTANSLGDLTKRENRFGHYPFVYPYDARIWGAAGLPTQGDTSHIGDNPSSPPAPQAGPWMEPMPWGFCGTNPLSNNPGTPPYFGYHAFTDYWLLPYQNLNAAGAAVQSPIIDPAFGALLEYPSAGQNAIGDLTGRAYVNADPTSGDAATSRYSEDVILSNVIGFDIKVWDPGAPVLIDPANGRATLPGDLGYRGLLTTWIGNGQTETAAQGFLRYGAYVDLFYTRGLGSSPTNSLFAGPGLAQSLLNAAPNAAAVYDTGSTHYERDGIDQGSDGLVDLGFDGLDNNDNGVVDDVLEQETILPYPFTLRSLQIKIRVFERDSKQVRELTVSHDLN